VDTLGQLDFSGQGNAAAGDYCSIGLRQSQSKMRRLHILAHLLGKLRKKFPDDIVGGKAVGLFGLEIHLADHAAPIDIEESGVRHPLVHALGFGVEDVEAANQTGFRVGQQRKLDFVSLGKVFQDRWTVIADRGEFDSLGFKSSFGILQLHELRFAKGSPVGGTEKEKHRSIRSFQCLIRLLVAKLVLRGKCGYFLP
jgi:hypothetical protein